jgi:hypothetical protein
MTLPWFTILENKETGNINWHDERGYGLDLVAGTDS